ncbi:glycerol dehydrogenase [Aureimonas fodinaquatilis]|uniref:Glycerol dehydrogenase n=1 Tax=Aureimonas fodinaquatilis TaxID=2565783 RepID=A0A5B0DSK3_9HYPH|nr:glycerol dehydrogenase [Aureimonas fodinaquatilis]KAA0969436.1 glycerol dehydrogenase [Aureimonas fodinaquatilis]
MIIFGSPSRYVQGAGALNQIGAELARLGGSVALLVDPVMNEKYGAGIRAACESAGLTPQILIFSGECTDPEISRLLAAVDGPNKPEIVAAIGGGKCIDAGKAMSHQLGARVVTVPSIASTDAPTSHIYVVYDDDHRLVAVRKLARNPELVIVDTAVIVAAPRQLFLAGIGDAIGKIHEVTCCADAGGKNMFGGTSAWTAVALAKSCHEIVLAHARDALAALDRGEVTPAFERMVEATVLMSGLAFESGGLSVAHSMTRGLSALVPWSHQMHGMQIAYANVVQMRLQGATEDAIDRFAGFCHDIGLPVTLADLGDRAPTEDEVTILADMTMTSPHIGHLPAPITSRDIAEAIDWVETRFKAAQ